jgi:RND family efflux transporter MFP subunit
LDQNKSTISNSQISLTSFQNDVSLLKLQNENNINAAKLSAEEALANLELQKANHNSLIAPPRDVDLAYLRSVLNQAIANRDKAIITSPINGIVTKINKEERELISMSEPLFEILSPKYQIEVNIPETDVTKISLGDKADIELDAIENSALKAEIASINPAATLIQDVVYYKVILTILEKDDRIKPGMTANILIYVDERSDVLYLPSRSILSEKDRKYVRVLQNGKIIEKDIEVGLNADDSKREILRGVNEDDEIVLKVLK